MAMMAARRKRYVAFALLLFILVIVYVTTGQSNTHDSDFYRKTLDLMNQRNSNPATEKGSTPPAGVQVPLQNAGENTAQTEDENKEQLFNNEALKERLQAAAAAAKQSADEKGHEMVDVAKDAAAKAKSAITSVAGSVAGRKKYPIDESTLDDNSVIKPNEDGVAKVGANIQPQQPDVAPASTQEVTPEKELQRLIRQAPMVIFSKSYCPYSKKAKRILLEQMSITPLPAVVELDQHDMGHDLQDLLLELTGRRTVPNVLVNGKGLGGGDDMERMINDGTLGSKIREASDGKISKAERQTLNQRRRR
jgi:glutaredoxin